MSKEEARCPDCERWSPVAYQYLPDDAIGGMWWVDSGGCPKCGALVCVESECDFRPMMTDAERAALDERVTP